MQDRFALSALPGLKVNIDALPFPCTGTKGLFHL